MNKQETIADIIAEMRALSNSISDGIIAINGRRVADRLESAWKRELFTKIRETDNSGAAIFTNDNSGDAAKLREALSDACYAMFNFLKTQNGGYEEMANALDKAKAALAAPPRNCDVGDADDWEKRFGEECDNSHTCSVCPVRHAKTKMAIEFNKGARCEFVWVQMPYEEGGANE